ncbi:hypothetical protein PIB30_026363 [Stylosanthes scabra]|uniref:Uncharacterized protein n=1 Tax=Stylosanthes scabra TaxID=79078 RepID=A0ABU6Z7Z3_9FABA|nr:hypothetical protein [Stylosanthes scabra]
MVSIGELDAKLCSKTGYEWLKDVVWCIPSKFVDADGIRRLGPPSSWVREGKKIKIEFLPCSSAERVCHKGPVGAYFFMYTCVFAEIGVRFPFTKFECAAKGVDRGLWVTLNSHQGRSVFCHFKATYRDFKEFYIKVRYAEDSFPFSWMSIWREGWEGFKYFIVIKVDSNKEYVIDYLEEKIPDCNTSSLKSFFKQRVEKELSSSQVVKIEKGTEVIDLTKVADEHYRSKVDLELLGKVGKVAAARYMQVEAAQMFCISREWEVQAMEEESSQQDKMVGLREVEESLKLAKDQVTLKEKENGLLKEENEKLKCKVSQLSNEKSELENRVVELYGEKKEVEVSKKAHGFEMFSAAWDGAKAQIELFVLGVDLEKMDPVKVVYKGQLVDDDQVPV